jgi:putative oxidoreductase
MNSLNRFADPVYCITRLIVGLMLASHGGQLVLGMFGAQASDQMMMQVGGWIQLVGGFMIAFGLLTRLAAFITSGEMAVAYFKFHLLGGGFFAAKGGPINGELAVFYCFFFLFVVFYGPGRWSLDAMLFKRGAMAPAPAT